MKRLLYLVLALWAPGAFAQSASDVANGTAFANSIAPTSPQQIVNPSGVNSSTWGSQTGVSTAVPSGLGGFSSPDTTSTALTAAQGSSLTAYGRQAESFCASYTPGSDPYENQYCAAVNFLNEQCMTPTTGEQSVLGATASQFGSSANCAGTYGAGQSQFGYGNQVTPSDPMFQVTGNLANTATSTLTQNCSTQTVVTQPAQYANNTCVVSTNEDDNSCSQYLSATITQIVNEALATDSCPSGSSLQGNTCIHQITYTPWISCPAGYMQGGPNHDQCVQISNLQGAPYCPGGFGTGYSSNGTMICVYLSSMADPPPNVYDNMPLIDPGVCIAGTCYAPDFLPLESCPSGYTFDGTECTMTITIGGTYNCNAGDTLQGQTCVSTSSTAATVTYSCPNGQTLSGTNCIQKTVTTTWTDTCTQYEQSAGVSLPTPTN
jgi:hypothetical protein